MGEIYLFWKKIIWQVEQTITNEMKSHLINYIARIGLLMMVLAGIKVTAFAQWNGVFYSSDQTINMTGDVTMTGTMIIYNCTVTIKANGANRTITRGSSFSNGTLFGLVSNGKLVIDGGSNTIIIDGNNVNTTVYGACIQSTGYSGVKLQLSNVIFKNHRASYYSGGAIALVSVETSMTGCSFINNYSVDYGGAIYIDDSPSTTITNCSFTSNSAGDQGGAIFNDYTSAANNITIKNTTITGNNATSEGGGIYNVAQLKVEGEVVIDGNTKGSGVASNVCIGDYQDSGRHYYIDINAAGLSCGSRIGVTKTFDFTGTAPSNYTVIAKGTSANCLEAFNNHYFFHDGDTYGVYTSSTSPYATTNLYFFGTALSNGWSRYADAAGCTISGGYVTHVNTAAGLAYLAKDIASGKNYSGKTVLLTADLAMNTHNWEPIGSACSDRAFCGTFNGQGHSITGLSSNLPYDNMGLFGYVEGGTIENTFVISGTVLQSPDCAYFGGLVAYLHGGTVSNCTASQGLQGGGSTVMGGLIGKADNGAVIHSCYCAATMKNGAIMGGVVGQLASASLLNSFAHAAFTTSASTTTIGGLVGVNTGHIENCYVRADRTPLPNSAIYGMFAGSNTGTDNIVRCYAPNGAADQFNHSYTYLPGGATTGISNCGLYNMSEKPYRYKHNDNLVIMDGASSTSGSLLSKLNSGVTAGQTTWMRTMGSPLNADYPIPRYTGYGLNCVGKRGGFDLQYSSDLEGLFTSLTLSNTNIFIYGDAGTQANPIVTNNNANTGIYIAEDVSIIHTSTITNAHVGVTLDPTNGSAGVHWHMFSPALSNAPLGINYTDNTDWSFSLTHPSCMPYYLFAEKVESTDHATYPTYGYFPSHNYGDSYPANDNNLTDAGNAGNYYTHWDFYTYYEPEYHWINFKRNGNSHHHEDSEHEHIDYHWDNNTSNSASLNINEPTLVRGKGYLVATDHECFLEAKGTLNQGTFTIPVTTQGDYRTGYNLLGNPYQSQFDFDKFADVNKALWGGTKTNASYVILNKDGYTYYAYSGSTNTITANRYLHPHQGFMIIATNSGTASFNNDMRVTGQTTAFRGSDHVDYPLVNLIVTEDDGNRDIVTVELGRPETGGAFKQHDLRLGMGDIYVRYEDQDYAIAFTQPGISEVGVRFESEEETDFTMTWDMENGEFSYLHLIDNMTGADIDCLHATEYHFTSRPSDYKSRFRLVFDYTGLEEDAMPAEESTPFAFMMGDELVVNGEGTLQMFDMMGRQVMQSAVSGTQTVTALPQTTAGVYVIRLSNKNGTRTQKIVIE
jgi:predicted outer membrane repeat protein